MTTSVATSWYAGGVSLATKDRTLRIRVDRDTDTRIRAAARAEQVTVSEFVLRPAIERADLILAQSQTITVPSDQFDAMLAALDEPVAPIDALVSLASRPRRFARA